PGRALARGSGAFARGSGALRRASLHLRPSPRAIRPRLRSAQPTLAAQAGKAPTKAARASNVRSPGLDEARCGVLARSARERAGGEAGNTSVHRLSGPSMSDPFEILGVSAHATRHELRAAFRR